MFLIEEKLNLKIPKLQNDNEKKSKAINIQIGQKTL